jgi:hypothetical protein
MQVNYNPNFGVLRMVASPRKIRGAAGDTFVFVGHAIVL